MIRHALVLAATVAALALPASALAAQGAEILRLTTVESGGRETDNGWIFTEKVYQRGKLVGTDRGVCVLKGQVAHCKVTIKLANGSIRVTTKLGESPTGSLRIVGGTGDYRGARGTGTYRAVGDDRTRVTLRIK